MLPYVLLIIRKGNSILLLKRSNTGFADGCYSLPGGKVEQNETFRKAAVREAYEELGMTISEENLVFEHVFQRNGTENELVCRDLFSYSLAWRTMQ